jgi:hypothetical protein
MDGQWVMECTNQWYFLYDISSIPCSSFHLTQTHLIHQTGYAAAWDCNGYLIDQNDYNTSDVYDGESVIPLIHN